MYKMINRYTVLIKFLMVFNGNKVKDLFFIPKIYDKIVTFFEILGN